MQCMNIMRITRVEVATYRDHSRQEDLEKVLDRKSWKLESSKDSKLWENGRKFEEFLKRKKHLMKKMGSIYTNTPGSI